MKYSVKNQCGKIFYNSWSFIVLITIFYTFYFQYGIKVVSGLMIGLCGVLIVFGLIQILIIQQGRITKSNMLEFLVFVFLSVAITVTITSNNMYGLDVGIRMIEYILAAYSIYLLLGNNPQYFERILWCFCISITLLACTVLIRGVEVSSSGALGLEGINSNSMSSYFLIMMFCSFLLMYRNRKRIQMIFLILMNSLIVTVQIATASRRGFIVLVMFLFLGIVFGIIPLKSNTKSKKRFIFYTFLILAIAVTLIILQEYILSNTILGARLLGAYDNGDLARARYQVFALEEFKKHPFLGIGIGGIAHYMGAYSHSMYYEVFSCTGVVLALVFLIGLFRLGFGFLNIGRKVLICRGEKAIIYLSFICFTFWLCLIVSGIAVVMIYDFHFYFSVALLSASIRNLKLFIGKEGDFR